MGFLARFAYLAESTAWSGNAIARVMHASSSQAFLRSIRRLTGQTPSQWRRKHGLAAVLTDFRAQLLDPYRAGLRDFDPFQSSRLSRSVPTTGASDSVTAATPVLLGANAL
jgi:hypothetical protein